MNGTKTYYIQPLKDSGIPIKSNASLPTTQEHDYVSAVFVRLLQPIADLCDQMLRLSSGEPNEVQTSPRENGYAISIIALAAFLLEGACGRVRYVSGWNQKQCSPAATLRHFGANDLADRVEEIFVVRDAIAHAHLWTAKISWTENNLRQQKIQENRRSRFADNSPTQTGRLSNAHTSAHRHCGTQRVCEGAPIP